MEYLTKLQNGVVKTANGFDDSSRNILIRLLKPNAPCPTPFTAMAVKIMSVTLGNK